MLEFGLYPSPSPIEVSPGDSRSFAQPREPPWNGFHPAATSQGRKAPSSTLSRKASGFIAIFCVLLGLPHGGSCGSRPGFLLPSSPASPRSSWASLLLKGLSRRALDLEAGLAENGGVGGVLGPTMGVRDFEVAPLFTTQTRFCSNSSPTPHTAWLSHRARASQTHTPAHLAGTLRARAQFARSIRNGCSGSFPVAAAFLAVAERWKQSRAPRRRYLYLSLQNLGVSPG